MPPPADGFAARFVLGPALRAQGGRSFDEVELAA
jgi:hypothetical protein